MDKKILSENEYHALRQMARHIIGLYYPRDAVFDDDVWWMKAGVWCEAYGLNQSVLHSLANKGQILRREVETKHGFRAVEYTISELTHDQIRLDLMNERIFEITRDDDS